MRKARFSYELMVNILREMDRDPVAQVAKRHGISEQTIYTWHAPLRRPALNTILRVLIHR